jgi:hypothetical protein
MVSGLHADTKKLSREQKIELLRGLSAEWAIAKTELPMSKKPLPFDSVGGPDREKWSEVKYKEGLAARVGDMVQITKVEVNDDSIKLEINDGSKKGSFWDRVQIGGAAGQVPISRPKTNAAAGTSIEIKFPDSIEDIDSKGVKKMLASVLNFDKRTAVETYTESLPAPIQEAIKANKTIVGMDQEQVILAMGNIKNVVRTTVDDVEYEEWIYGQPPGVMTFVKFQGSKVVEVREFAAGIGGSIATTGPIK